MAHPCDTPRDRNPMHRYREAVRQRDEEVEACGMLQARATRAVEEAVARREARTSPEAVAPVAYPSLSSPPEL